MYGQQTDQLLAVVEAGAVARRLGSFFFPGPWL
jgi:hypothetical protein